MGDLKTRLKEAMSVSNISVAELAEKCGVPAATLFSILNGRTTNPRMESVTKITDYLKIDPIWLMTGEHSVSTADARDFVQIPMYNITFGCGTATEPTWEELKDVAPEMVERAFFQQNGVSPEQCRMVRVCGDSMSPQISDGDIVLLDCSRVFNFNDIIDGKIYAFVDAGGLHIKRLRKKFKSLVIHSDNSDFYDDETVEGEDLNNIRIVGRVIKRTGPVI